MARASDIEWHALPVEEALKLAQTTADGLSKQEAAARLAENGPNALTAAAPRTLIAMIWEHFNSIITYILLAAAIIAGVFQEWIHFGLILAIIITNTFLGVFQEGRAEAATRAIRNMVASNAVVTRNNKRQNVPATSLVVGDVVHLAAGDRVPADIRWIDTSNVQVTEAALTGESLPITKTTLPVPSKSGIGDRTSLAYSSTLVFTGQGSGVVIATGNDSAIGKINKMMAEASHARTPLLVQIDGFGRKLSILCIIVALATFFIAWGGRGMHWKDGLSTAVSVAVALIPEGLGIVVTITLSAGVQAMAQRGVIVRQLPAVETLGAVTVICSDKTGTLTRNEMTAVMLHTSGATLRATGRGYNPDGDVKKAGSGGVTGEGSGGDEDSLTPSQRANLRQLLLVAALCNDATLMPTNSLDAQNMLATQPITVPLPQPPLHEGGPAAGEDDQQTPVVVGNNNAHAQAASSGGVGDTATATLLTHAATDSSASSASSSAAPAPSTAPTATVDGAAPEAVSLQINADANAQAAGASAAGTGVRPSISMRAGAGVGPGPLATLSAKIQQLPPEPSSIVPVQTTKPGRTPEVATSVAAARMGIGRPMPWNTTGDPTEAALLAFAMKAGLNLRTLTELNHTAPRIATIPFNSDVKFMATLHDLPVHIDGVTAPASTGASGTGAASSGAASSTSQGSGASPESAGTAFTFAEPTTKRVMLIKGAPEVLLARCNSQASQICPWRSEPLQKQRWLSVASDLSHEGLRVLALCQKEMPADRENITPDDILGGEPSLQLNCLVGIIDPPRDDATAAIKECHGAGIRVTMITGDHAETAATIGGWMGLPSATVITGAQLQAMNEEELRTAVEGCSIFARTTPEHKLRIVKALQSHGHVCAMTGDGVNDAPALKAANVGIAMGITGTEVAKEAGKMILTDDNFASIAAAVKQGRGVYSNIVKQLTFMLAAAIGQGLSIAVAIIIGTDVPLTAIQVLYVNMLSASTLGLVVSFEKTEADVMQRPPRRPNKALVGTKVAWRILFAGFLIIAVVLGNAQWTIRMGGSVPRSHTVALNTLVITQAFFCLSCRFENRTSISVTALTGNPWLTSMVLLNAGLQALITYTPALQIIFDTTYIDGVDWARILGLSLAVFLIAEAEKLFGPRYVHPISRPIVRFLRRVTAPLFALCACCARKRAPTPLLWSPVAAAATAASSTTTNGHAAQPAGPAPVSASPSSAESSPAAAVTIGH